MHGRKRAEYKHRLQDAQLAAGMAQKAQQWYTLSDKALQLRQATEGVEMTLPLLDKMLRVNPDPLHLWNHRRVILLQDSAENWITGELQLTAAALERNPKAYGAWFHRKWVLQQAKASRDLLQQELALTEQFLQYDERNFHCWNFRRFLVGLELSADGGTGSWSDQDSPGVMVVGPQITIAGSNEKEKVSTKDSQKILQREWDFTQTKIVQNFSNFSAFHYRGKLMALVNTENWTPIPAAEGQSTLQTIATSEWSLMESILFTEPDDQTIWWYHRFVLDYMKQNVSHEEKQWYGEWLQTQSETLQMLVDDEPECKWGLLGYHLVLSRLSLLVHSQLYEETVQKMDSVLDQLMEVDPDRKERYETLRSKK